MAFSLSTLVLGLILYSLAIIIYAFCYILYVLASSAFRLATDFKVATEKNFMKSF
jgi:hypothetical protein